MTARASAARDRRARATSGSSRARARSWPSSRRVVGAVRAGARANRGLRLGRSTRCTPCRVAPRCARARAVGFSHLSARARSCSSQARAAGAARSSSARRPRAWEARGLPVTREALLLARCFLFGALGAGAAWRGNAGFALYPAPSLAVAVVAFLATSEGGGASPGAEAPLARATACCFAAALRRRDRDARRGRRRRGSSPLWQLVPFAMVARVLVQARRRRAPAERSAADGATTLRPHTRPPRCCVPQRAPVRRRRRAPHARARLRPRGRAQRRKRRRRRERPGRGARAQRVPARRARRRREARAAARAQATRAAASTAAAARRARRRRKIGATRSSRAQPRSSGGRRRVPHRARAVGLCRRHEGVFARAARRARRARRADRCLRSTRGAARRSPRRRETDALTARARAGTRVGRIRWRAPVVATFIYSRRGLWQLFSHVRRTIWWRRAAYGLGDGIHAAVEADAAARHGRAAAPRGRSASSSSRARSCCSGPRPAASRRSCAVVVVTLSTCTAADGAAPAGVPSAADPDGPRCSRAPLLYFGGFAMLFQGRFVGMKQARALGLASGATGALCAPRAA